MRPLFSIITVTYNAEATLPATLRSVAAQTFRDFEYIIMDGASTDRTLRLAIDAAIPQSHIFSSPDDGIYDAMNLAMERASGEYLIFLNAGDAFHSRDTLAHIADLIAKNDYPGIVYGQTDLVDASRHFIAPRHLRAPAKLTLDSFRQGMTVCHQAFVTLRRIAPHYNTDWKFSADYEWCIKCLQKSRHNIYAGDTPLIDYLAEGTTTRHRYKSLAERFRIMGYYFGWPGTIVRHFSFIPRFISYRLNNKKSRS
ncbi:MAG: glycosyltransferase [Muribaculum sp.]|nr:glycosyltransferase [Muribaculum sp.]